MSHEYKSLKILHFKNYFCLVYKMRFFKNISKHIIIIHHADFLPPLPALLSLSSLSWSLKPSINHYSAIYIHEYMHMDVFAHTYILILFSLLKICIE